MNRLAEFGQQLMETQKKFLDMVESLKRSIYQDVMSSPMKGVASVQANIAVVRFSAIAENKMRSLAADYYIPKAQADAVCLKLYEYTTPEKISAVVKEMIETKRVTIGRDVTLLNDKTVQILRDSELGQFALN